MEKNEIIEIPKKFEKLVKEIENLSVLDLADLVKILEKKFGVSASAPIMTIASPQTEASKTESVKEEKTSFSVVLTGVGDKKIEVIKIVRDLTQQGLKEAKDMVDAAVNTPQIIKDNAKKEEAEEIKKKFEAVGAKVELK